MMATAILTSIFFLLRLFQLRPFLLAQRVKRIAETFEIVPKRWVVERTFGWLNRYRRLSKDYQMHVDNSEAMIYGCLIRLMIRRLAS